MAEPREHKEQDCWCDPNYMRTCPECAGDGRLYGDRCWKCNGARISRCEAGDEGAFSIHVDVTDNGDETVTLNVDVLGGYEMPEEED